jgi:hypothetical protein
MLGDSRRLRKRSIPPNLTECQARPRTATRRTPDRFRVSPSGISTQSPSLGSPFEGSGAGPDQTKRSDVRRVGGRVSIARRSTPSRSAVPGHPQLRCDRVHFESGWKADARTPGFVPLPTTAPHGPPSVLVTRDVSDRTVKRNRRGAT